MISTFKIDKINFGCVKQNILIKLVKNNRVDHLLNFTVLYNIIIHNYNKTSRHSIRTVFILIICLKGK